MGHAGILPCNVGATDRGGDQAEEQGALGPGLAKLNRAENDIAAMNRHIIEEIEALEAKRPQIIADALAAFIGSQQQWLEIQSGALEDLLPSFPSSAVTICTFLDRLGQGSAASEAVPSASWASGALPPAANSAFARVGAAVSTSSESSIPSRRTQSFETASWLQNGQQSAPAWTQPQSGQQNGQLVPQAVQVGQAQPGQQAQQASRNPFYSNSPRFENQNPMVRPAEPVSTQQIPVDRLSIGQPQGQVAASQSFQTTQVGLLAPSPTSRYQAAEVNAQRLPSVEAGRRRSPRGVCEGPAYSVRESVVRVQEAGRRRPQSTCWRHRDGVQQGRRRLVVRHRERRTGDLPLQLCGAGMILVAKAKRRPVVSVAL
eukprot:scaffold358_cov256-Pinguiococcus_pyrenoidosus.AAC.3